MNTTMALYGQTWIIGDKQRMSGADYLRNPVIFVIMRDQMVVHKLPGEPDMIPLDTAAFHYPVKDGNVAALYLKATTGIETPPLVLVK